MYRSVKVWRDLEDGHLYQAGEPFPFDGREVSAERIAELTSSQNKAGFAVIKAIIDENPSIKPEAVKTAKKTRKKAT